MGSHWINDSDEFSFTAEKISFSKAKGCFTQGRHAVVENGHLKQ